MATTVTLKSTGREIMNAVKAGKTVLVHSVLDGYDEYDAPYLISFSEADDNFIIAVKMDSTTYELRSNLDGQPSNDASGLSFDPTIK